MISVVIPTCERPDLLALCLERLAPGAQTLPAGGYEVIVSDDGAATSERLIGERFPWATWVSGPRRGPAANRNSGAGHAQGEWLAFTDDDCLPDRGWLAGFANATHGEHEVYEGMTVCRAGIHSPLEHAPVNTSGGCLWSCNMLVKAAKFRELGGFDENFPYPYLEDVEFRERLVAANGDFKFVPQAVVDHPPRRVPTGWRCAVYHSSYVYFWYKTGHRGWCTPWLLWHIFRCRLNGLVRFPPSFDTILATISMIVELAASTPRLGAAEFRYRCGMLHDRAG